VPARPKAKAKAQPQVRHAPDELETADPGGAQAILNFCMSNPNLLNGVLALLNVASAQQPTGQIMINPAVASGRRPRQADPLPEMGAIAEEEDDDEDTPGLGVLADLPDEDGEMETPPVPNAGRVDPIADLIAAAARKGAMKRPAAAGGMKRPAAADVGHQGGGRGGGMSGGRGGGRGGGMGGGKSGGKGGGGGGGRGGGDKKKKKWKGSKKGLGCSKCRYLKNGCAACR
jgi:hypothetical protein